MIEIGSNEWCALKTYMHLEEMPDGGEDAALVQGLHTAAASYLSNAGVTRSTVECSSEGDTLALYNLVLQAMTLDMYDNRGSVSGGSAAAAAVGVREMINQLKSVCMEGYI